MKLNLGCGFNKLPGWLNLDKFPGCEPDRLFDIEATQWDLDSDAFEVILLRHVLEHVGADFRVFGAVMQELYRVAAPGGLVEIHVPHVRHDAFWSDPTHVRAFTPLTFQMLSKRQNRIWIDGRDNFTMLAMLLDVDFEVETVTQYYDPKWRAMIESGQITREEVREKANECWNVAWELQVRLRAVK